MAAQRPVESRGGRPPPEKAPAPEVGPALDDAILSSIVAFDMRLPELDHYGTLDVDRHAEKAAIKRAYYALASKFHPDRHYGKDLGRSREALHRIFTRITQAHDVLTNRARRAEYDASLPHVEGPSPPPAEVSPAPTSAARRAKTKASLHSMRAVDPPAATPSPLPAKSPTPRPPPIIIVAPPPAISPAPLATEVAISRTAEAEGSMKRLQQSAQHKEVERRVRVFITAAEEALKRDDFITAANNYRLALENDSNPALRDKLRAIESQANDQTYNLNVVRGKSAERGERWSEAADYFGRANKARPDAYTADRAACMLRLAGGDMRKAVQFAEQAVLADSKRPAYRMTLGEVCLAADLLHRAAGEAERALALAPNDPRAKALVAAVKKKK